MTTTATTPQQIGHVIAGEAVVGNDVRDDSEPGRVVKPVVVF